MGHDRTSGGTVQMTACVLCNQIGIGQLIAENDHAVAFFDSYPLNPGHALVIPRNNGDVPNPRGGVRWVLPQGAAYWNKA